jgi:hypothetical protein
LTVSQSANQRWSLDFLSDALADGGRLRILAIVGDFTGEPLAWVVDTSNGLRRRRQAPAKRLVEGLSAGAATSFLNETLFASLSHVRWRLDHNTIRGAHPAALSATCRMCQTLHRCISEASQLGLRPSPGELRTSDFF